MKGIYLCIEVGLTVGLLYLGDKFGTTNMWIIAAAIIAVHFLIEALCKVYEKVNKNGESVTAKVPKAPKIKQPAVDSSHTAEPVVRNRNFCDVSVD